MKKCAIYLIVAFLFFLKSAPSHSQLFVGGFVEPMLTFETGNGNVDFPAPFSSSDSKVRGLGLGARVGAQVWDTVFAGIDGRYSYPNFKENSLNQNIEARSWNFGPMIGIQMPSDVGLRFWGNLILAAELNPERDRGVDEVFKSGNGFRVGGGIKIVAISLNLEFQYVKYEKAQFDEVGIFNTNFSTDNLALTNKSFIVSSSYPIGL